jgi:hypothetical protein
MILLGELEDNHRKLNNSYLLGDFRMCSNYFKK